MLLRPSLRHDLERPIVALVPLMTAILVTVPLFYILVASFTSGPPGDKEVHFTVANWVLVYTSPAFLLSLWNSLKLGLLTALFSTAIGFVIAWVLQRTDTPGRQLIDQLMLIPFYIPSVVMALAWISLAGPRTGYLNVFWQQFLGGKEPLLEIYSFTGILFVLVMHFVPLAYLVLGSSIRSISKTLEEASEMCRASRWQTFLYITVPILVPALLAASLQVAVFAAEQFSVPYLLGIRIGFNTIPVQIYRSITRFPFNYNEAGAAGTLIMWFTISGVFLYRYLIRRSNQYATIAGKDFKPAVQKLGRWRYATLAGVLFYLLLAMVLPVVALIWGSLQSYIVPRFSFELVSLANWILLFSDENILQSIKNSLLLGTIGATFAVLFCFLVSYVSLGTKVVGRSVGDYVSALPMSVPGIVLGLGFLWFYVRSPLPLYGTLFGLGVAYGIRYMGHGVRMTNVGLVQIHTELLDAARVAKATTTRTMKDILFPLLRRNLISTWMILFILFFLELNVTILLYRAQTKTMSVYIWSQLEEFSQVMAFPVSVLQCLIIFVVVYIVSRLQGISDVHEGD